MLPRGQRTLWNFKFSPCFPGAQRTMRIKQNVYSNLYSQAVTHPSTNRSQPCLTSVIRRELVFSRWYGRRHSIQLDNQYSFNQSVESIRSENHDKYSWVISNYVPTGLTLVIEREYVLSRGYGRRQYTLVANVDIVWKSYFWWTSSCIRIRTSGLHWPTRKFAVSQLLLWYTPLKKCYQAV